MGSQRIGPDLATETITGSKNALVVQVAEFEFNNPCLQLPCSLPAGCCECSPNTPSPSQLPKFLPVLFSACQDPVWTAALSSPDSERILLSAVSWALQTAVQRTWKGSEFPPLPLVSWVTLGKFLNLSEPLSSSLKYSIARSFSEKAKSWLHTGTRKNTL